MNATDNDHPASDAGPSAWEEARLAGLDMDLLEDSLHLTPFERIRLHTEALLLAESLRRAMEEQGDASTVAARSPSRA